MLAARLFGLEQDVIEAHCTPSEIGMFRFLSRWFVSLIACTYLSMTYFFYLLSESIFIAPILGCVITFVFFSIFRFSLISISIPLHEEFTWKRMFSNSGNILRMCIITFFLTAISFPLAALFFSSNIDTEIEKYKEETLIKYQVNREVSIKQSTRFIDLDIQNKKNEIQTLKNEFQKKDTLENNRGVIQFKIDKIEEKINDLNNKKVDVTNTKQKEINQQIEEFQSTLTNANLPIIRCLKVLKFDKAKFFVFIFIIFFLAIIPFYIKQLSAPTSNYAINYIEKIKSQIVNEFSIASDKRKEYLKAKFGYDKEEVVLYEDVPFNVKPLSLKAENVVGIDLFTHFFKEKENKV
jgi:hypothetical protein